MRSLIAKSSLLIVVFLTILFLLFRSEIVLIDSLILNKNKFISHAVISCCRLDEVPWIVHILSVGLD